MTSNDASSDSRICFRCLRCSSPLEASVGRCGQPARCPTCGAEFVIPDVDFRTGLAIDDADPGDDGENPTPMHAYAAAGEKAPRIIRLENDTLAIMCPRCERLCDIGLDACPECGLPFTLEGANRVVRTSQRRRASVCLFAGVISVPLGLCGGAGLLPGGLAVILGLISIAERPAHGRGRMVAGTILGTIGCVLSLIVLWAIIVC